MSASAKCTFHFMDPQAEVKTQPTFGRHQAPLAPPLLATYLLYHVQPGAPGCKITEHYPQNEVKAAGVWDLESVLHVLPFLRLSSPNHSKKKTEVCVRSKYIVHG